MTTGDYGYASKSSIETAIRIAIIAVMAIVTIRIIQPFLMFVGWGIIIAVAVNPFIAKVSAKLGGRRKMTSILFAVVIVALLIIPTVILVTSSIETVQSAFDSLEAGSVAVPPPPDTVAEWPLVGNSLHKSWSLAHTNLEAALKAYSPQLKEMSITVLGAAGGGVKDVLMFVASVIIAAALLVTADKGSEITRKVITRFAGPKGPELQNLSTAAIRGVMLGVIGVAVIQSVLSAIGMVLVGVPAAGLWAVLVLICAIIQLPPILVLGPIAAWVFSFASPVPAVIFLVWAIIVSACDGFLKPVLMGRGVDAPMLVILIGALGGMMSSGIVGMFVGAVIVTISYTIFMAWVHEQPHDVQSIGNNDNPNKATG